MKLNKLLDEVQHLHEEFCSTLPRTDGLLIRSSSLSDSARKVKHKYITLRRKALQHSSLEGTMAGKRGRKRQDSKFRNRFGKKANKLRKVYIKLHASYTCRYKYTCALEVIIILFIIYRKQQRERRILLENHRLKNLPVCTIGVISNITSITNFNH